MAFFICNEFLQIYAGYDNKKKKTDHSRRVSIVVPERYAVIVRFNRKFDKCFFVTAFIVDADDNLNKLIQEEIWRMPTHCVSKIFVGDIPK